MLGVDVSASPDPLAPDGSGRLARYLDVAREQGHTLPRPGAGRTGQLWGTLAELAASDLSLARVVEPHLDALAILAEAGLAPNHPDLSGLSGSPDSVWGVFAAESAEHRLSATRDASGAWSLTGVKPWCSLAASLSHALVTAWVSAEQRGLFAVRLNPPQAQVLPTQWHARGLQLIETGPVRFDAAAAVPVGAPGWYLSRPGFAWGGIGVAACWYGGAVGLARRLAAPTDRARDQIAHLHLGIVDTALHAAHCVLMDASGQVDAAAADWPDGQRLALRARQVVADAAEVVIRHVDHALGPAPLAFEDEHARRVDDLRLYLRQHHAERDLAALGALVVAEPPPGRRW